MSTGEGELLIENNAITISIEPGADLVAQCRNVNCGAIWEGRQGIIALGHQAGEAIDADKIRDALTAVEEMPYVDDGKVDEAFDPKNPDHQALAAERASRTL